MLLVTGAAKTQAAIERRTGFLDSMGKSLNVTLLDGRWAADEAQKAIGERFKLGAERNRSIDLVVCQNDNMALGVRRALLYQTRLLQRPGLASTPLIGCDGLEEEGQAMVHGGSLVATVMLPATTPVALDVLINIGPTARAPARCDSKCRRTQRSTRFGVLRSGL